MRDLIVSVPDHCLSFYFEYLYESKTKNMYILYNYLISNES